MKESYFKGMTRALALTIAAVFIFTGVPALMGVQPAVVNASAATTNDVQLGWLNFEVQNWNPLCIEMVEDYVVCYLLYSGLWTYDENWGGPVNDLATGYYQVVNGDESMDTFVNITDNAFFRNAANPNDKSYNLKASDVIWTFETIQANPGKTFDWYLLDCTEFEETGEYQVRIHTDFVKATLIDDLSSIPILSEDYWVETFKTNPMKSVSPDQSFGTGPFVFNSSLSKTWYRFDKGLNYFGEVDYPGVRDINFDAIVYNVYTDSNALVVDMNNGDLDAVTLSGDITNYVGMLGVGSGVVIIKQAVQEPGICNIAINAIPTTFRTSNYGTGNPILLDPVVRKAIMMTLNKSGIVEDYLQGLAIQADSVVQPGFWHYTPENQVAFDPDGARDLLEANGYVTNEDGWLEVTEESYAYTDCGVAVGTPLTGIRCQAPDTDPTYYDITIAWRDWAAEAGIGFDSTQESEGYMTSTSWYQADYDIWVWHWGWGPEPLGGALSCWVTSEIVEGGDNCQKPMGPWWYGLDNYTDAPSEWGLTGPYSAFDQNFSLASETLDVTARKAIADKLQQWVYDSYCENPPYYDLGLYGLTDARFSGWGDWEAHNGRPITSDLLWTWFDLVPATNKPPIFNAGLLSLYEPEVDTVQTFTVTISDPDDDPIQVNWSAGDGIGSYTQDVTGTTSEPTTISWSYTYLTPTTESLEAKVTIWDHELNHEMASTAEVNVVTELDYGPNIKSLLADPAPPALVYVDQSVNWTLVANDTETGDEAGEFLRITWNWDDGSMDVVEATPTSAGADVTVEISHTWEFAYEYNVTVYVYDMTYDNIYHNVSTWMLYDIIENTAPSAPSVSAIAGLPDQPVPCVARATDTDADVLTFWWDWGNDTFTKDVKDTSANPGAEVTSTVYHTWTAEGNYAVTVSVDDGEGHNESTDTVAAIWEGPVAPTALGLVQDPSPGMAGAPVTLNLSAADANEDALTFYLLFGDGNSTTATTPGGTYELQHVEVTHTYEVGDTYTATLFVNDTLNNVSQTFDVVIASNAAPSISLTSSYIAVFNAAFSVTPISVSDADGDTVTVWYDWGDDTPVTMGGVAPTYTGTHTYMTGGTVTLRAYADDGQGHNSTASASVNIQDANSKPSASVVISPSKSTYDTDETITFTVTCSDDEGDTVTVNISFGDETYDTETIATDPEMEVNVTFTHEYTATGTYEWTVTVMDDVLHADMTWQEAPGTIVVEKISTGISMALIGGIVAILAIVIIAALYFLMKKRKKSDEGSGGGMEGMAPPEPPPPAT